MINPDEVLKNIPIELDTGEWDLDFDNTDIQVYSQKNACNSPVIGFKTVTYHLIASNHIFDFLEDVCGAMNRINHLFILGEKFRDWPTKRDPNGTLVRTSFRMPFPMKNREFLHGLHSQKLDDGTHLIAYTPIDTQEIPVQKKFIRCPMYVSGQRITQLDNGTVRVEHLMVYALDGAIRHSLQDRWFRKSHVKAYLKEWRNLREYLFPPKWAEIDYPKLRLVLEDALIESDSWTKEGKPPVGSIKVGRVKYCSRNSVRTDLVVNNPIRKVVDVIADNSLQFLPLWNKEFLNGEVLKEQEVSPKHKTWLIRVHYKTPFFLDNREYVYHFSREWITDDECIITYHSVEHNSSVPQGFVRALLYPSVHRCRTTGEGTSIEHLLVTDLGGKLGKIQDKLLKKSLVKAHCRDLSNQFRLFGSM